MFVRMDGNGTKTAQLYRALRQAVLGGALPPGSRMPATRPLALDLELSRNIVTLVYDQLTAEGYLEGRVGAGTFVANDLPDRWLSPAAEDPTLGMGVAAKSPRASPRLSVVGRRTVRVAQATPRHPTSPRPLRFDFAYGEISASRSLRDLASWGGSLSRRVGRASLAYSAPEGILPLREAVAAHLRQRRGVPCQASQVLIVNGSQQGLDLSARLLVDPGDRVLIEEPHYQGARRAFAAVGAKLVPCRVDSDGVAPERFPPSAEGARLAYVTPSHQFPSGAVLPLARRLQLLQWASRNRAYVVEDDYDGEFRYEGKPLESLFGLDGDGRTIYVGTFSKVLFPSLRLGFLVLPVELVEAFREAKWIADRQCPNHTQEALADYIARGDFERHLRRMRSRYAKRRDALLVALDAEFGTTVEVAGPSAGVHLVAWLNDVAPERLPPVLERAEALDVGVYPIAPYYLRPPTKRAGLLLGFASLEPSQIREGITRLRAAVEG